ncbi:quinone oxidoreductase family protein [Natronomonas sp. EA1]|uniref:quinone oxidoreductase family protein n=1 Tax=Natronomonas sp. EA1 TaxID=3421655 RepID=UPI003EBFE9B4
MQAIQVTEFGDSDTLEVVETDVPEPGPGEVRIEVRAAGINFADIMQRRGHYHGGPEPPYVAGMEVAGVVDAVGEGSEERSSSGRASGQGPRADVGRSEGDEVVAMVDGGGYAEFAVADAQGLFDIPEPMSFEEAAGFPVQFLTAHNCLFEWGELEEGESVLIHAAAGGVGTAAVQLASNVGAHVIGTASTSEKLETASELGCDVPINYTEEEFVARVKEETDYGADLVLDGIGGETTEKSLDALKEFGRMVSYGAASGRPGRPPTDKLLFGNKTVKGYHLGRALARQPMSVLEAVPALTEQLASGALEVQVGHTFPLAEARAAHDAIENRETSGKVVLVP